MNTILENHFDANELKLIEEMVRCIWEVDVHGLTIYEVDTHYQTITIPVLKRDTYLHHQALGFLSDPTFDRFVVHLDRWLVPWKVRAGYFPLHRVLFYTRKPHKDTKEFPWTAYRIK